jgi:hypothetical protein
MLIPVIWDVTMQAQDEQAKSNSPTWLFGFSELRLVGCAKGPHCRSAQGGHRQGSGRQQALTRIMAFGHNLVTYWSQPAITYQHSAAQQMYSQARISINEHPKTPTSAIPPSALDSTRQHEGAQGSTSEYFLCRIFEADRIRLTLSALLSADVPK